MIMLAPHTLVHDRYHVVRIIGQGGFGAVYEAVDVRLNKRVALKQLLLEGPDISRQFAREARLLAHLDHPSLPRVSDHFADASGQFLVMDFVAGDDLAKRLHDQRGPFPVAQVVEWSLQLLDLLHYLHDRPDPIIHRDIKPQNLKVRADGRIMLLDFGLAKGYAGDAMLAACQHSILAYTKGFSPPEQVEGTGTDVRADLYALGATLYYLLTLVAPLDASLRCLAAARKEPDPLRPPGEHNPGVPRAIGQVVMRALALNPEARPRDARQMRELVQAASGSSGAPPGSPAAPHVLPPPRPVRATPAALARGIPLPAVVGRLRRVTAGARLRRLVAGLVATLLLVLATSGTPLRVPPFAGQAPRHAVDIRAVRAPALFASRPILVPAAYPSVRVPSPALYPPVLITPMPRVSIPAPRPITMTGVILPVSLRASQPITLTSAPPLIPRFTWPTAAPPYPAGSRQVAPPAPMIMPPVSITALITNPPAPVLTDWRP